jgi:hypothetical protein
VLGFLRRHCASDGRTEASPDHLQRRALVVKLLFHEKRARGWYKAHADDYMRELVKRLDSGLGPQQRTRAGASANASASASDTALPLELLAKEAEDLEDALYKYPERNRGGVPLAFLQYAPQTCRLEEDGVELVTDPDVAGASSSASAAAEAKEEGGGGEAKQGRHSSGGRGAVECIEVLDDD